ncbi:MAG: hypothetical protein Kow0022_09500 [Phycisphaerales bacterium]
MVDPANILLVELSLGLEAGNDLFAVPFYKSWRVRFDPDGGEPRLLAR